MVASTLLLAGYSTIPKSICGNGVAVNPVTFEQLSLAPGLYQDQVVRVGRKVINVINLPTKTILELAVQPLNSLARPEIHHDFQGRVLVYSDRFLDPDNFRNRFVTVLGKMEGTEEQLIGKRPYRFVKLSAIGYQVWQLDNTFLPNDGWVYAWAPEWGIVPPPGYIYAGPEMGNQNSYLEP